MPAARIYCPRRLLIIENDSHMNIVRSRKQCIDADSQLTSTMMWRRGVKCEIFILR